MTKSERSSALAELQVKLLIAAKATDQGESKETILEHICEALDLLAALHASSGEAVA